MNIHHMSHTYIGTQCFAASHLFSVFNIVFLIDINKSVAIAHPMNIATIQAHAIIQTFDQLTTWIQAEVIHAHISHPKIAWVIDTGAFKNVAMLTQRAAQRRVESIIEMNSVEFLSIIVELIIHHLIVSTTSHPAIRAQLASKTTAIAMAQLRVSALLQTAGHILFATSFAHRLIAIYIAKIVARSKYILQFSELIQPSCVKYT